MTEHASSMPTPEAMQALADRRRAVTRHLFQAVGFQAQGDHEQASNACRALLALDPHNVGALCMLGTSLLEVQRRPEAWPFIDRACALAPLHAAAVLLRVRALREEDRRTEAIDALVRLLEVSPGLPGVDAELGNVLLETGAPRQALQHFDRALEIDPGDAPTHMNRAIALQALDRIDEAMAGYDQALALEPGHALAVTNRNTLLHYLGRIDEAIAANEAVLSRPDLPPATRRTATYNQACSLLQRGDYEPAWPLLEARWGTGGPSRCLAQPLWLGEPSLRGATILLHWEQGLGDTLMMSRFASDVAAGGARVILSVQPPLVRVLQGLEGVERIVSLPLLIGPRAVSMPAGSLPAFDFQCPLFSLPLALRLRAEDVPGRGAYLRAEPERLRRWAARLGPRERLRIGIAWSGNAGQPNDHRRSMALADFLRGMPRACELVSLQPMVRDTDRQALSAHPRLRHFGGDIADMADTAALCELVDLVVSVDTSVAHLAGAMGRPVWILLCFAPDWRWHDRGEASAWYDSARLLRQPAPGDWGSVLARVREELAALPTASRDGPL